MLDGNRRSNGLSLRGKAVGTRSLCSSTSPSSDVGASVDADDVPSLREYIATLGVFFTLPEQGVTSPEILTRFDSAGHPTSAVARAQQYTYNVMRDVVGAGVTLQDGT